MKITIDASVFVAAARTMEPHFAISGSFLRQARAGLEEAFCPTLILPECSAAIARRTGDVALALAPVAEIESWPGMQLIQLTISRARRAAQIAADQRLRGADSVCVAIAEEFAATLITWDSDMLQRGASLVTTMTPADWLAANQTNPGQPS